MRFWILAVLMLALPAAADPLGPLEQPPDDYTGTQYIDTAGCVYLRQGKVWAPRLDRDGMVICGYPPSLPGLAIKTAEAPDEAALRLSVTLAEGLQDGDVRDHPRGLLDRTPVDVPRPRSGPLAELDTTLRAVPAIRAASAQTPDDESKLCDLLGYDAAGTGSGGAWALGFCSGGTVLQPNSVVQEPSGSDGAGQPDPSKKTNTGGKAAVTQPRRAAASETAPDQAGTVRGAADTSTSDPAMTTVARKGASVSADLVPAGARYVQIGRYPVPREAEAAILRLVRLGYPAARGRRLDAKAGGRLVMAGPFVDRQALIAALNHLRKAGYPRAFAR